MTPTGLHRHPLSSSATHLKRIGRQWHVRIKVPARYRWHYGKTSHITRSLGVESLAEANLRKHAVIHQIKREFVALDGKGTASFDAEIAKLRTAKRESHKAGDDIVVEAIEDAVQRQAERIEEEHGTEAGVRYFRLATSLAPTLQEAAAEWLPQCSAVQSTRDRYKRAVDLLAVFLKGDRVVEDVTDNTAFDYAASLRDTCRTRSTFEAKLRPLSSLWEWMERRRAIPRGTNPWKGHEWRKERPQAANKRPYTDDELLTLFSGTSAYPHLPDLIVLGLYTGARIDELAKLRCSHVSKPTTEGGGHLVSIAAEGGKRGSSVRVIVVTHPTPAGILVRLKGNRQGAAWLFEGLREGGPDRKRSFYASKSFGNFRTRVGLPGAVDFHSFRRTLITRLENTPGMDETKAARYCGHKLKTMTWGIYSSGSSEATQRLVADAIRFPAAVESAAARFVS